MTSNDPKEAPAQDAPLEEIPSEERRKNPRSPAGGQVLLAYANPAPVVLTAKLVDVSESGFRAEHDDSTLQSGLRVRFCSQQGLGTARVVWTQCVQGNAQSGFAILSRE